MSEYIKYDKMLELIEEMVDEHSLTEEVGVREFSSADLNYDELKKLTCNKILQMMMDLHNDDTMSDTEKFISITSSMSYLAMENFYLHYEMMKKND